MIMMANDIRGPCGLKLPDILLTGEEKPRKNLTQETYPDRGSNQARCVWSAHATTCSTAVDNNYDDLCFFTMHVSYPTDGSIDT